MPLSDAELERYSRHLLLGEVAGAEQDLALQIGEFDVVAVQDAKRADAGCREVERRG